jgi:hypothetical protein
LYQTPNIRTKGWIDIRGSEFVNLMSECLAVIFPSCSEGQAGSVTTCMHGGLIPIVSRESGIDLEGFGRYLDDCSIPEICRAAQEYSTRPATELKDEAFRTWEFARANYTQEAFAAGFEEVICGLLGRVPASQPKRRASSTAAD